jgi:RNA polymerase sigma-70 factor (ECF subfamily)
VLYARATTLPLPEKAWVDVVRAIAHGDQRALRGLYEQTHRLVFTLAFRIVGNRESAEEVVVDVYHQVWRRAATYDAGGGSVVGWIMNQARSRALDRVRFDHRQKRTGTVDPAAVTSGERGPDERFEHGEQARQLRDALAILTPTERTAIESAFFAELTYQEVAAQLREPLGTVKTRIRSGLGKLRRVLSGEPSQRS